MNQVDFLPQSFIRRRAQRVRVMRQVLLVAVVAGGLLVWGLALRGQVASHTQHANSLEEQVVAARNMKTEMNRLREEQKQLHHQVKVQRQLSQPVTHTQIIATLSELIPSQIAVTELLMTTARRTPQQAVPENAVKSRKRQRHEAAVQQTEENQIAIELQALSPDGESVANLVETFSKHPLFTDVQIRHTRSIRVRQVVAREFRLELKVDLDRRFLDPEEGKEVARAD
jgi:Tfp pilus assembly protein PilN